MSDNWLDELRQLHEDDKALHQVKIERQQRQEQEEQAQRNLAFELLQQSQAYKLVRQVQKNLLGGGGALDFFDNAYDYERVISLVWQGPISAARRPNPNDPAEYSYILVGVKKGKLCVNGQPLPASTPTALKNALLKAAKNPERTKRGNVITNK